MLVATRLSADLDFFKVSTLNHLPYANNLTGVPFGDTLRQRGKVMTRYQKIFKDIKKTSDYKTVGEDID